MVTEFVDIHCLNIYKVRTRLPRERVTMLSRNTGAKRSATIIKTIAYLVIYL